MKRLMLFLCLCALCGCSATGKLPQLEKPQFNVKAGQPYPPLTLRQKQPSSDLQKRCAEFDKVETDRQRCRPWSLAMRSIQNLFQEAGFFEQVDLDLDAHGQNRHDYTASIAVVSYSSETPKESFRAFFSMFPFFLPRYYDHLIEAEIDVAWRGRLLKQYRFQQPTYTRETVLSTERVGGLGYVVAAFLRDSQLDGIYSGDFLLDKLGASDYATALAFPKQVLGYRHKERHIHLDPLLGARLDYRHTRLPDSVTVQIYPVRAVRWDNPEKALQAEMDLLQRERRLQATRGSYLSLDMPAADFGAGGGMQLNLRFSDRAGEEMLSQVRLFLKKDKIIKFTKTGPQQTVKQDLDALVAAILPLLDPPGESAYMAAERQKAQEGNDK